MTEAKSKTVAAWAVLMPNGYPLSNLVASTRRGAIEALGKGLWPRARKNGYRIEKVWITPWGEP